MWIFDLLRGWISHPDAPEPIEPTQPLLITPADTTGFGHDEIAADIRLLDDVEREAIAKLDRVMAERKHMAE